MSNLQRDEDKFKFFRIADARQYIDQEVNLIGVVTEVGIPKLSDKGSCDPFCTLKIVDDTQPTSVVGINFFTETFEKLPQVQAAGDIIQLYSVVVRRYESLVNAVFYKQMSSFGLYKGNDGSTVVPYQVSSNFHTREQDKKLISDFRKRPIRHQPEPVSTDRISLQTVSQRREFNLICKVLHVCKVRGDGGMLFVWDGTDAPPLDVQPRLENNLLPLRLEAIPLPRDVLCSFPTVGTVLRMVAKECRIYTLKAAGRWVHLKHVKFEVRDGLWCGTLTPFSKFSYLSDNDNIVTEYQRSYEERFAGKWTRMPMSSVPRPSLVTETDHKGMSFVTLMDILTYQKVTYKYRCVVRVVAIFPGQPSNFCGPNGHYRLRLTLEDPTARIHAYLYDKDAEKFFGGHPSKERMIKMLNALLGVEETNDIRNEKPRSPPWVDCCIKSYYGNKSDRWGSRKFAIFDTRLVG